MTAAEHNGRDPSSQSDDRSAPAEEWPEEANAAAAFFSSALFLIHEGWNRLEDLGWVEEFGSDSQRAILNLDHLDPFSIRALSARDRRD
ncbi:MAG TPA: hypothetical protein VKR23_07415 [Gaiellaceae bacterium]|nr:hypothetical protein [Gaiellaceae bacterium]